MHFDYLPDLQIRRRHLLEVPIISQAFISLIVEFLISLPPLQVIPRLFHEGHRQHECEGGDIGEEEADLERGYQLREADEEEEEVEEELELVEEHHRDERDHVVLRVVQLVTQVTPRPVPPPAQIDPPLLYFLR